MKYIKIVLLIALMGLFIAQPVAAVWWNPFTWFTEGENGEQVLQGSIEIGYLEQNWYEWNKTKTIKHAKLNITAPTDFTTCNISPDGGDGWDKCFAFVIVENNFQKLPQGIMNFNSIWKKGNVRNVTYQYSREITDFQNKHIFINETTKESTNSFVPAKLFDNFSSELPNVEKGESFVVKILFEKKRWTEDSFDFKVSAGGEDITLDPDVSACGALTVDGGYYTQTENIVSTPSGGCIKIGASNITFDGNSKYIIYDQSGTSGNAIISNSSFFNITIKNTILRRGTWDSNYAISLSSNYSNIINNTISTRTGLNGGAIILNGNFINITSNYIINSSTSAFSTSGTGSGYNFSNNFANTAGGYGFQIANTGNNINYFYNNIINNNIGTTNSFAFRSSAYSVLSNNTIVNISASSSGQYYFQGSLEKVSISNLTSNIINNIYFVNANNDWFNISNNSLTWISQNSTLGNSHFYMQIYSWTQTNLTWSEYNISSTNAKPYFKISGLLPNTYYNRYTDSTLISTTQTNSNGQLTNFSVGLTTTPQTIKIFLDTNPPASITNLQNSTTSSSINWTWTNPTDLDFNYTSVYINGLLTINTSNQYYLLTPITIGSNYTISTHTVDTYGNVNTTWVNNTVNTTALKLLSPANTSTGVSISTSLIWQEYPTNNSFTYQLSTDYQYINIISQGSGSDLGYGNGTYSSGDINLEYNTKYFWHVKNATGSYINSFEFTTVSESQVPGSFNISVWDEQNISKQIMNYTIQLYNSTHYLSKVSAANGWTNFSTEVANKEYLIIATPSLIGSDIGATSATGNFVFYGNVSDGQSVTIVNGSNTYVFEFNTSFGTQTCVVTNCIIVNAYNNNNSIRASGVLTDTINSYPQVSNFITAVNTTNTTTLTHITPGTVGNIILIYENSTTIVPSGYYLSGGTDISTTQFLYYPRMILATSPADVTMYVPNSTSPNILNLIKFSLNDITGNFPYQTSVIKISKGGLVMDKSYFSADATHDVYLLQSNNYQITITYGSNTFIGNNYVPTGSGTSSITINDFAVNSSYSDTFIFNITHTKTDVTLNWNDKYNFLNFLNFSVYQGTTLTPICNVYTVVKHGQTYCTISGNDSFYVSFSALLTSGSWQNTSFWFDTRVGTRQISTGISSIDGSPIGTGFIFDYETFVMPDWIYTFASVVMILILLGSFGAYYGEFGAIISSVFILLFAERGWFRPFGTGTLIGGIDSQSVVIAILTSMTILSIMSYIARSNKGTTFMAYKMTMFMVFVNFGMAISDTVFKNVLFPDSTIGVPIYDSSIINFFSIENLLAGGTLELFGVKIGIATLILALTTLGLFAFSLLPVTIPIMNAFFYISLGISLFHINLLPLHIAFKIPIMIGVGIVYVLGISQYAARSTVQGA